MFRGISLSMIFCQAADRIVAIANYNRSILVNSGGVVGWCNVTHGSLGDPIQIVGLLYTTHELNASQLHT